MKINLRSIGLVSLLAVSLGLISAPASAQPMVSYGVKGGLNLATLSFDPDLEDLEGVKTTNRTGAAVGGFVNIGMTDMFSIQPELLFSMKGAKQEAFGFEGAVKVNLVQIPILGRADFPTMGQVRPFVLAGPAVAFKVSAKEEFDGEEDDLEEVSSTDFSVIVGGGVEIRGVSIEARYDLGLKNLNTDDEEGLKVKSRAITILFGIRIPRP
jgi:opacity protein-like surface antigen